MKIPNIFNLIGYSLSNIDSNEIIQTLSTRDHDFKIWLSKILKKQ